LVGLANRNGGELVINIFPVVWVRATHILEKCPHCLDSLLICAGEFSRLDPVEVGGCPILSVSRVLRRSIRSASPIHGTEKPLSSWGII